ncbi:ribonuclease P protein component [Candidatus Babeliales bacterium]|nr:ribonuclease P protein component [Candidatus Babeliales bacterium]
MVKFKQLFQFKQKEIKEAFEKATLKDKILGLKLLQAPSDKDFGKLLIVIPAKTGTAYKRNKIRRQIKAIFYEENLFKKATNSILFVYKQSLNLTFEQIKGFLIKNLK